MFYNKSKNLFFLQSLVTYSLMLILASLSHWREPIYLIANDYLTTWTPPYDFFQWCLFATVEKMLKFQQQYILYNIIMLYMYILAVSYKDSPKIPGHKQKGTILKTTKVLLYKSNKPVMALHRKQARWYYNYIAKSN